MMIITDTSDAWSDTMAHVLKYVFIASGASNRVRTGRLLTLGDEEGKGKSEPAIA